MFNLKIIYKVFMYIELSYGIIENLPGSQTQLVQPQVLTLNISDQNVMDELSSYLSLLDINSNLEIITCNLHTRRIEDSFMSLIVKRIIRMQNISKLNLDFGTANFSDNALQSLEELYNLQNLEKLTLKLEPCNLNEQKIINILEIIQKIANKQQPLLSDISLNLSGNNITSQCVVHLVHLVKTNTLKSISLDLNRNSIDSVGAISLLNVFKEHKGISSLNIMNNAFNYDANFSEKLKEAAKQATTENKNFTLKAELYFYNNRLFSIQDFLELIYSFTPINCKNTLRLVNKLTGSTLKLYFNVVLTKNNIDNLTQKFKISTECINYLNFNFNPQGRMKEEELHKLKTMFSEFNFGQVKGINPPNQETSYTNIPAITDLLLQHFGQSITINSITIQQFIQLNALTINLSDPKFHNNIQVSNISKLVNLETLKLITRRVQLRNGTTLMFLLMDAISKLKQISSLMLDYVALILPPNDQTNYLHLEKLANLENLRQFSIDLTGSKNLSTQIDYLCAFSKFTNLNRLSIAIWGTNQGDIFLQKIVETVNSVNYKEAYKNMRSLALDCGSNDITDHGITLLNNFKLFEYLTSLTVGVQGLPVTSAGVSKLIFAKDLKFLKNLIYYLGYCQIGDQGMAELSKLKESKTLSNIILDLRGNGITDLGASKLIEFAEKIPSLTSCNVHCTGNAIKNVEPILNGFVQHKQNCEIYFDFRQNPLNQESRDYIKSTIITDNPKFNIRYIN